MTTNYAAATYLESDDLQFIDLVFLILKEWKIWMLSMIISVSIAFAYTKIAMPKYRGWMTFITPSSKSGSGSIGGYASILGVTTPGNIEDQILTISKSALIKSSITEKIKKTHPEIFTVYESEYKKKHANQAPPAYGYVDVLGFEKNFNIDKGKTGPFTITYQFKNPTIAEAIVKAYLESLKETIENLELSPERDVIKVVDRPQATPFPVAPRRNFCLLLGFSIGLMGGISIIVLKHQVEQYKKSKIKYVNQQPHIQ